MAEGHYLLAADLEHDKYMDFYCVIPCDYGVVFNCITMLKVDQDSHPWFHVPHLFHWPSTMLVLLNNVIFICYRCSSFLIIEHFVPDSSCFPVHQVSLPSHHFESFLVPQTVDHRIKQSSEDIIQEWDLLVSLRGIAWIGPHVDVSGWSIEECDHSQVGGTGGESFASGLHGLDLEDGPGNMDVGGHNEGQWGNNHEDTND